MALGRVQCRAGSDISARSVSIQVKSNVKVALRGTPPQPDGEIQSGRETDFQELVTPDGARQRTLAFSHLDMRMENSITPRSISGFIGGHGLQTSPRSMKTCTNILTASWPVTPVAKATRHSLIQGCAFDPVSSVAYVGQPPEMNLDRPEVGR